MYICIYLSALQSNFEPNLARHPEVWLCLAFFEFHTEKPCISLRRRHHHSKLKTQWVTHTHTLPELSLWVSECLTPLFQWPFKKPDHYRHRDGMKNQHHFGRSCLTQIHVRNGLWMINVHCTHSSASHEQISLTLCLVCCHGRCPPKTSRSCPHPETCPWGLEYKWAAVFIFSSLISYHNTTAPPTFLLPP